MHGPRPRDAAPRQPPPTPAGLRQAATAPPRTLPRPGTPRSWLLGVLLVALLPVAAAAGCPAELAHLVPDATIRVRLHEGGVQVPLAAGGELVLVPALPSRAMVEEPLAAIDLTYGAEILRLIPLAAGEPCDWLALYNHLRAVSTLQGIEYYSSSRGHYRTLYKRSHAIVGPRDRTPQPDPLATSVPSESSLFLMQEDSTFGYNAYQADYRFDGMSIGMHLRNITTMWWTILPLVAVGDFRSVVLITPTDQGLLFYAAAAIHALDLDALHERGQTSLSHRLDSLERWLRQRLAVAPLITTNF